MKYKFGENLEKKKKDMGNNYENMLNKYMDVKKNLDSAIEKDLDNQEDEFARKKRERRERSISRSMNKKKSNPEDEEKVEDTSNLLGDLAGGEDRKKKLESGDFDTPFN